MEKSWTGRNFGHQWGHAFFYTLVRWGGRRWAQPLAYFFLYFVVLFYLVFVPGVKSNCRPYLRRRFPRAGVWKQNLHAYRLVLNQAKVLVDRAILGILGPGAIGAYFETPEDVQKLKSLDSGFVLLMSHVGGWQVALPALGELNRRVHLLMLQKGEDVNRHFQAGEALNIINPDQFLGGTLEMMAALGRDEVVSVMGDRLFGNAAFALDLEFMGDSVPFPVTAFKLAGSAQKPLVILTTRKTQAGDYAIRVQKIMDIPKRRGRGLEKYHPFAQTYVGILEAYVQENPHQFFNFFDMWEQSNA